MRDTSKAEAEHRERACNSDWESRLMSIVFKCSTVIPPREDNGGGGLTALAVAISG